MSHPVIVIGAGGHAKVLIDALLLNGVEVLGIADTDPAKKGTSILGVSVIGDDRAVLKHESGKIRLVNGMGSVGATEKRRSIYERFTKHGYAFASVVHPSAIVAGDVKLEDGAQVMAGAVVQPGATIGANSIVNTRASVDHDCVIGAHAHLAPGVTLSGGVVVGEGAHLGTGATVIQGVKIGERAIIGAASLVLENVSAGAKALGSPARVIE